LESNLPPVAVSRAALAGESSIRTPEFSGEITGQEEEVSMLGLMLALLLVALIAAVLGFGGIAGTAAGLAKILFVVFLVLAAITFLARGARSV
jgi:uncharacterized membrane protein YtjA (UPF0391 family)